MERVREIHGQRLPGDDETSRLGVGEPRLGIHQTNDSSDLTTLDSSVHSDERQD